MLHVGLLAGDDIILETAEPAIPSFRNAGGAPTGIMLSL
jgi:hypothetical protein